MKDAKTGFAGHENHALVDFSSAILDLINRLAGPGAFGQIDTAHGKTHDVDGLWIECELPAECNQAPAVIGLKLVVAFFERHLIGVLEKPPAFDNLLLLELNQATVQNRLQKRAKITASQ